MIQPVVTRGGYPLGYELFDGNRIDVTTVEEMEGRHGRAGRVWVMDRGMTSESNLQWLREGGRRYLVGTPKSEMKKWARELIGREGWNEIRAGLEVTRVVEAQSSQLCAMDFLSMLVSDELECRQDRLIARRIKQARFRDAGKTLDGFDFDFNKKMNRKLAFGLAAGRFVARNEDALLLGPPGTGKSHLVQAIGHAVILQGWPVAYREAHVLLEELADATLDGTRKEYMAAMTKVPLLIIDDLGMRKLPHTAAEDLLELVMRRYERASTVLTSNRPVEDWGKLLGDTAAGTALLDRLLHHAHLLKCGPRSWRTQPRKDLKQALQDA